MPRVRRRPTHAGSWYSDEAEELAGDIQQWLAAASPCSGESARAIIAPHAGYRYSGHVMAFAYRHIVPPHVARIFLLGPSHHVYAQQCLLSPASAYSTPFGDIEIDAEVYRNLQESGIFQQMTLRVDEAEHSLELHLPYIAAMLRGRSFTLVPIMVGALSSESEALYGQVLAPYLDDPRNLFVISSDFCHWGSRFNYTFYDKAKGQIHESIKWLDHKAIQIIKEIDPEAFQRYMQHFSNTICGRHPIAVLLHMLRQSSIRWNIELEKYDQSSKCIRMSDSSVSYVAAVVRATS